MIPILFSASETAFTSNGLGYLTDVYTCSVEENRNGAFEAELTYPITGIHYSDIKKGCYFLVDPNPYDDPQPFQIYEITRPLNGIVTVRGRHISYLLSRIPVSPFSATNAAGALSGLSTYSAVDNPFIFWTDKSTTGDFKVKKPASCRSILGGTDGSIVDVFGGEWKFNMFSCQLYGNRGSNRGVEIRYGKNLTDIKQEESIESIAAGVYPFWYDEENDIIVELPEYIMWISGVDQSYGAVDLDLSSEFDEQPTVDELRAAATTYLSNNDISTPTVSLDVSFSLLSQFNQYKDYALLERVELCDTVKVIFEDLAVESSAKVIKTIYDPLTERYTSIKLGEAQNSLAATVAGIDAKIRAATESDKTHLQQAIDHATQMITGNLGGYVVIHASDGGDTPDEILIMDTPSIDTAQKVWRWNKSGLGYSSTGYNGTFGLAMTADGAIVADYITTGTLDASQVTVSNLNADSITSGTIDASKISVTNLNANNITSGTINADYVKIANSNGGMALGYGKTSYSDTTVGAMIYGGTTTPSESRNYVICTGSGVRMSHLKSDGSVQYDWYASDAGIIGVAGWSTSESTGWNNRLLFTSDGMWSDQKIYYREYLNSAYKSWPLLAFCQAADDTYYKTGSLSVKVADNLTGICETGYLPKGKYIVWGYATTGGTSRFMVTIGNYSSSTGKVTELGYAARSMGTPQSGTGWSEALCQNTFAYYNNTATTNKLCLCVQSFDSTATYTGMIFAIRLSIS